MILSWSVRKGIASHISKVSRAHHRTAYPPESNDLWTYNIKRSVRH